MKTLFRRTARPSIAGTAFALLTLLATALPSSAQEMETMVDRPTMERFVRAHIAINEARDEFHGEVARVHDPEGRLRAREMVEEAIDGILEEHEMTRDEFDELTLMISLDGELRALFDELMLELSEGGPGG